MAGPNAQISTPTQQADNVIGGSIPIQSIPPGTSVTGAGAVLDNGACRTFHQMVVTAAASTTGGVVALDGSMDGTNWVLSFQTLTLTTSGSFASTVGTHPFRYIRANITTQIVGATVGVTIGSSN